MTTHTDTGTVNIQQAALTMAISVLVERIRTLPDEDTKDLFELSNALFAAETDEDRDSAAQAISEILKQAPIEVRRGVDLGEPGLGLRKWMGFVGDRIRQARRKAGLTQKELAERSGLRQSHISRLERGRHSPSFVTVEKIAKALDIPVSQLDPSAE
jgi:ribosome-binding protein aMBF1 (putative translation factor)